MFAGFQRHLEETGVGRSIKFVEGLCSIFAEFSDEIGLDTFNRDVADSESLCTVGV
jgi:hypothetical protein